MPGILKPADFAARFAAGEDPASIFAPGDDGRRTRLVAPYGEATADEATDSRAISFAISTAGVARDGMTIAPAGWKTANFLKNPVVLWAHDDATPAIGRAIDTRVAGGVLRSTGIFATREIHPLADTIYQLLKQRFLNAVSVGFQVLKAQRATEPERAGDIDIVEQELWEWSVVNVPADPEALVSARSVGIDTGPLFEWTERLLDSGGMLIVPRGELETLRRMARMPTAPVVTTQKTPPAPSPVKRSLWHVSDLASLLYSLGWLQDNVAVEAEIEGDDSPVPAQLLAALKALGQVLMDMTAEEVAEFLDRDDDEEITVVVGDAVTYAADKPALRAMSILSAIAGQARSATGVRYLVEPKEPISDHAARRMRAEVDAWKRTPGATLVLDGGVKLRIYDAPASAAAAEVAAGGDKPAETVAPDEATLRRGRKARAARLGAAASLLKHS
jgi:HK97 family phage prohead protease